MSRCDYDVVFYRIFCVTLLAVAFTFIVILTNVFVDIDGLLLNKKNYIPETTLLPETYVNYAEIPVEDRKVQFSNEYKKYDLEINPSYRTKRFIESETTLHDKSPALKKLLTRRLASLLEELDEEEAKKEENLEITSTKKVAKVTEKTEDRPKSILNEDLLHLAMHNILLQGLIGHMDLNDVYKKVHVLVEKFNKRINNNEYTQDTKLKKLESIVNSKEILKNIPGGAKRYNYNEENQFFDEMMKCKKLKEQIARTTLLNKKDTSNKNKTGKGDKVFIKTVIEINEINRSEGPKRTKTKENIEGLIKLIYNGKSIKLNPLLDETKSIFFRKNNTNYEIEQVTIPVVSKDNTSNYDPKIPELNRNNRTHSTILNKVLGEYLKKHSIPKYEYIQNSAELDNVKTQRLKRQIKIRYPNNNTSLKTKPDDGKAKKNEDDLYIEIETHFDGKGIKGEKKKKLVRSLIDKIQKALNSDIEQKRDSDEHIKFIKRTQDPIYSQNEMSLIKKIAPLEPIEHRQLDPIGKTLETHENIVGRAGDPWKKKFEGPNFLSVSKAVNSAEMNELIVDYDSVLKNGISKRLQKPLNTESMMNDEDDSTTLLNPHPGNVTLFLKDIDGSGFSIGFNQYAGEPPDRESLKMFDGIENLIKEYHKRYDEVDNISNEPIYNKDYNLVKMDNKITKNSEKNSHKMNRRSITEVGSDYYNAKIHKIFLKGNPVFHRYLNIFKRGTHKSTSRINDETVENNIKSNAVHKVYMKPSIKAVPIIVDERIISKNLTPSEILTIANLIKRKRRSVSVKKISNLKSKIKLNRYLNTKTMANKKLFLKRKRNKRQVRVVAKNQPRVPQISSDENIFFISRENAYLDKDTSIRDVATADTETNTKHTEYIDEESPFNNIYRIQNPIEQNSQTENLYNAARRSKGLMSKYPHIFLDKNSNSKEFYFDETPDTVNEQPYRIQASPKPRIFIDQEMTITTERNFATVLQGLVSNDMIGAVLSQPARPKYKITVKMTPKNQTSTNGFKEIHTSVNKSFDENGLRYFTLLNVSQISKIEKLNKSDNEHHVAQPKSDPLFNQQKQIKNLLRLHKKRVDLQLNGLLRESDHLEKMIESSKKYSIDEPIHLLADIYKDKDAKNVEKAMDTENVGAVRIRQENYYNTESISLKTTPTTSNALTLTSPITEAPEPDKSVILDTIKQNEKLTLEILKKIDTNTKLLQTFLQKISERIGFDRKEHTTTKNETTEKAGIEVKLDLSKDWKTHGANQNAFFIPNELKNDTIPFVYAYQQSIPLKSKSPQSLASMVYHGHIHTNPVQTDNETAPKMELNVINTDNSRRKSNESKFFLDEVDTFQVTPNNNNRVISANIKINTTNVI